MVAVSDTFLAAVRGPQVFAVRVTAYPPTGDPVDVPISGGTFTEDRTADHRGHLELAIADPRLYPSAPSIPLNAYGTEIVAERGLRYPDGTVEYVQLGVFRIETVDRDTPGSTASLEAWDRSRQIFDQRFQTPRNFGAATGIDLIELLITQVYPAAVFDVETSDTTTIPKHTVDRDRWAEVQRIARVIGCEVYPNRAGVWVIRDVPDPTTATSVWSVDAGPSGVLVGTKDSISRESAPNGVVAIGEAKNGGAPVYGIAHDDNPASPTLWGGPYGKVPRFYESQLIRTTVQANRVAAAQLRDHLGVSRAIAFDTIPNPALEAGDAVTIIRPDGSSELHLIDVLTIPLSSDGAMSGETRATAWDAA